MSAYKSLQISANGNAAPLTPDQVRFNFLTAEIEKARKARADWDANSLKFRKDYSQKLQPLRASLTAVCRETVFAIDHMIDQPGWSRADRAALREILCGTADALLEANSDDVELKAIFDKHSEVGFNASKQEELQQLKEHAEELMGLDLGAEDIRTEDELVQRMYKEMAAREAAEEARQGEKSERRRKSAAEKRSETNAQLAKQSIREIYRKLASAVHPDRESDPQRRDEKNALMQKINQAYAQNDLMTLFETQMQLEQMNSIQMSATSKERLRQYNKLLAEQLTAMRAALKDMETAFCMDFGLPPTSALTPPKLSQLIQRQARLVRAEIAQQQQFLRVLADKPATKRWLKQQRQYAREDDAYDDEF
jgi:hypothetical protein